MCLAARSRRALRTRALPLLLLAAGACGGGTSPAGPGDRGSSALTALGKGAVTGRYTAELTVRGNTAYTSTWGIFGPQRTPGNAIYIWDVSSPRPPRLVDSAFVAGVTTTGDVELSDDGKLLVVATEYAPGSAVVFDLANPRAPRQIGKIASINTYYGVHTAKVARVGGTLYAFLAVDPGGSLPGRLVIADLTDPTAPTEVFAKSISRYIHDVFVRDGLLFTALWEEGLTIWDIGGGGRGGSVRNPVQLGNVVTVGGSVHNVWWYHDPASKAKRYAFVGEESAGVVGVSSSGDIHVVDVTDLAAPREVAFYRVPGAGTHNFSVDEARGILYAAYYNGGVRALDVRGDLSQCTPAERATDGTGRCDLAKMGRERGVGLQTEGPVYVWGVQVSGATLFASDMLNGLWALEALTK